MKDYFHHLSVRVSKLAGSVWAFVLSIVGVIVWVITGPLFNFSNTWLLVISALTDIVIFVMVFSIQNTQTRDSKAIQLKLNELILADKQARDMFVGLETFTDEELNDLDSEFQKLIGSLDDKHVIHKLHKHIAHVKNKRRVNFSDKVGSVAGSIIEKF